MLWACPSDTTGSILGSLCLPDLSSKRRRKLVHEARALNHLVIVVSFISNVFFFLLFCTGSLWVVSCNPSFISKIFSELGLVATWRWCWWVNSLAPATSHFGSACKAQVSLLEDQEKTYLAQLRVKLFPTMECGKDWFQMKGGLSSSLSQSCLLLMLWKKSFLIFLEHGVGGNSAGN